MARMPPCDTTLQPLAAVELPTLQPPLTPPMRNCGATLLLSSPACTGAEAPRWWWLPERPVAGMPRERRGSEAAARLPHRGSSELPSSAGCSGMEAGCRVCRF